MASEDDGPPRDTLGAFLRTRRARLDPADYGFPTARRRTPGLRREEVAQRAHVSVTWYTWLEQGRGGAPSADVLDRLARALELTEDEREHLQLLADPRPPVPPRGPREVPGRLTRLLAALDPTPAYIKNAVWDVLAWNHAATRVLTDYGRLPAPQRNVLRLFFEPGRPRDHLPDWPAVAAFVVAAFRADAARAGMPPEAEALIAELTEVSPEFRALWAAGDVRSHGGGHKYLLNPEVGPIALEYGAFVVDGERDLGLVVYTPASPEDAAKVRALCA